MEAVPLPPGAADVAAWEADVLSLMDAFDQQQQELRRQLTAAGNVDADRVASGAEAGPSTAAPPTPVRQF